MESAICHRSKRQRLCSRLLGDILPTAALLLALTLAMAWLNQ